MEINRVLLSVLHPYKLGYTKSTALRAGLGYVAQALEDGGVDYRVFDAGLGYKISDLIRFIEKYAPQLIGISMSTYRYLDSYRTIMEIKRKFKNVGIVVGGPHATTFRESILKECPAVDFVIVGEGESTMLEICQGKNPADIPGLVYRKNGDVSFSGARPPVENLDSISFPRYHNFELENYPIRNSPVAERVIPVVTSRGCPFECIYCPVGTVIGRKFRKRTVESVLEEIRYWYDMGYRKFSFIDDNFTLDRRRVWQFCEDLRQSGMKNLSMSCPNGIRADKTDKELLRFMYEVGFRFIGFGVEAGNDRILASIKKAQKIKDVEEAIKNACEIGFYVDLFFLVGTPEETEADVHDSFRLAAKYPVDNVYFFNVIPYPGTCLYKWVDENNYFVYPPGYYLNKINSYMNKPVFHTPALSVSKRKKLLKDAKKLSRTLKLKKYIEKFKGIGLPEPIAKVLSMVYGSNIVQRIFNDVRFTKKIKNVVLRLVQQKNGSENL